MIKKTIGVPHSTFTALLLILSLINNSCKKTNSSPTNFTDPYTVSGNKIFNYNHPVQLIGANAFHSFGAGGSDMNSWKMDVAREFIGNIKEMQLSGTVIQDANGAYLHSMQTVADSNRNNHRITIFGAFGWDGTAATVFSGQSPAQTSWWGDYKLKLRQWAEHFKGQQDVWLEVWNEPYRYDRADGYTDTIWWNDMTELVIIIRSTGNNNIILLPCAEQGQDETVLINKGASFAAAHSNILFDIHAYEKWLLVPNAAMGSRLQQLKQLNLPIIFGEVAPVNASSLMNPGPFLDSAYNRGLSVCGWVWKRDGNDTDALLDSNGLPNNNSNNNWGTIFKNLSTAVRKP